MCKYVTKCIGNVFQDPLAMAQQYSLRWNNHQPNFISQFTSLLNTQTLVDVTLSADGVQLLAHKVVLSACSTYFQVSKYVNICLCYLLLIFISAIVKGPRFVSQGEPCYLVFSSVFFLVSALNLKGASVIPSWLENYVQNSCLVGFQSRYERRVSAAVSAHTPEYIARTWLFSAEIGCHDRNLVQGIIIVLCLLVIFFRFCRI